MDAAAGPLQTVAGTDVEGSILDKLAFEVLTAGPMQRVVIDRFGQSIGTLFPEEPFLAHDREEAVGVDPFEFGHAGIQFMGREEGRGGLDEDEALECHLFGKLEHDGFGQGGVRGARRAALEDADLRVTEGTGAVGDRLVVGGDVDFVDAACLTGREGRPVKEGFARDRLEVLARNGLASPAKGEEGEGFHGKSEVGDLRSVIGSLRSVIGSRRVGGRWSDLRIRVFPW